MHGKFVYILWPESNERFVAKVVDVDTTARTATLRFDSFLGQIGKYLPRTNPLICVRELGRDDELIGFLFRNHEHRNELQRRSTHQVSFGLAVWWK